MDKRSLWRTQEQELVARWNVAVARRNAVMAEISVAGGVSTNEMLALKATSARTELEAVRRQIARLKVEFNSGKRY